MKSFSKIIICFLLSVTVIFGAVGCAPEVALPDGRSTKVLYDFDDGWSTQQIEYLNHTSTQKVSNEHVTQGSGSALMTVTGLSRGNISEMPKLRVNASSVGVTDAKTLNNIGVDIYNDNDDEMFVGLILEDGEGNAIYSDIKSVAPYQQKSVRFYTALGNSDATIKNIDFIVYKSGVETEGMKYYIDNMTATTGEIKTDAIKSLSYGEILSFSEYSDLEYVYWQGSSDIPAMAKGYENSALCLDWLGHTGQFGSSIDDMTDLESQVSTLVVSPSILNKIDFSGISTLFANAFNGSFVSRKVTMWYESAGVKYEAKFTLMPNAWQTISIQTNGKKVEKMGFDFNSADLVKDGKTLIRSIRYAL